MVKVSAGEPNHGEGDSSTGRSPAEDLQVPVVPAISVCGEVRRGCHTTGQRSAVGDKPFGTGDSNGGVFASAPRDSTVAAPGDSNPPAEQRSAEGSPTATATSGASSEPAADQPSAGRAAVNSFPTAPGVVTTPVGDPAEPYSMGGGGAAGPAETPAAGPPVGSLRGRGVFAADDPAGGEGVGATRGAPIPDLPTTTISPWKAARRWYDHDPMRLAAQMPPEFRVHMLDPMAEHDVAIAAWFKGGRP
jgi:hypothetical protein